MTCFPALRCLFDVLLRVLPCRFLSFPLILLGFVFLSFYCLSLLSVYVCVCASQPNATHFPHDDSTAFAFLSLHTARNVYLIFTVDQSETIANDEMKANKTKQKNKKKETKQKIKKENRSRTMCTEKEVSKINKNTAFDDWWRWVRATEGEQWRKENRRKISGTVCATIYPWSLTVLWTHNTNSKCRCVNSEAYTKWMKWREEKNATGMREVRLVAATERNDYIITIHSNLKLLLFSTPSA